MKPSDTALIKKYLTIYNKNPKSKVFALLADLYRKQGEVDKAFHLCKKGTKEHPQFALGHIALALIFLDMNKLEITVEALEKAIDLSPENIFAYKLLGQTWLKLKNPEKTLQAYKMVLFLDPGNKNAENIIRKLEPTTAAQYDETGFAFKTLEEVTQYTAVQPSNVKDEESPVLHPIPKAHSQKSMEEFKARSAMIEALIYRKEFIKARQFLQEMKNIYTHHKQFTNHIQILENKIPLTNKELQNPNATNTDSANHMNIGVPQNTMTQIKIGKLRQKQKKIQKLRQLLTRIEQLQSQAIDQP